MSHWQVLPSFPFQVQDTEYLRTFPNVRCSVFSLEISSWLQPGFFKRREGHNLNILAVRVWCRMQVANIINLTTQVFINYAIDNRWIYQLTRDGRPVVMRAYAEKQFGIEEPKADEWDVDLSTIPK